MQTSKDVNVPKMDEDLRMNDTMAHEDEPKSDQQSFESDFDGDLTSKTVDIQNGTKEKPSYFPMPLNSCLKYAYHGLLMILVLITGCLSRVLIHVMIWKLSPPDTSNWNLKLVSIIGYLQPDADVIIRNSSCEDLSCSKGLPLTWTCNDIDNQTCTLAEDVPTTNVTWIWAVMLTISAPYVYILLTNFSRCCTKSTHEINYKILFVGIIRDVIHSIALCVLVFFVLPTMAPDMAAVTVYIVTCVPVILNVNLIRILSLKKNKNASSRSFGEKCKIFTLPVVAVFLFFLSLGVFLAVVILSIKWSYSLIAAVVCICVSLEWFENYVIFTSELVVSEEDEYGDKHARINMGSKRCKNSICLWIFLYAACKKEREYCALAVTKLLTLNVVFLPLTVKFMTHWKDANAVWKLLFVPNGNSSIHSKIILESSTDVVYGCNSATPFILMIICICSTFVFFKLAQHACRIQFQVFGFVIPIFINLFFTPIVIALVQMNSLAFIFSECSVLQPLLKTTVDGLSGDPWLLRVSGVTGFASVICLTLIPCCEGTTISLQKANKLFSKPAYLGIYPDVSLLLSRKSDEKLTTIKVVPYEKDKSNPTDSASTGNNNNPTSSVECTSYGNGENSQNLEHGNAPTENVYDSGSNIKLKVEPIIVACATMWHEELEEMCKLMESLLRLGVASDEKKDKKYGFEAHIFFDDAFTDGDTGGRVLNKYAENLYDAIDKSMRLIYKEDEKQTTSGNVTEYGWRITWDIKGRNAKNILRNERNQLNNKNGDDQNKTKSNKKGGEKDIEKTKLVVHFKDKEKIRVKKRWSQVMYMHYLLTQRFKPGKYNKEQRQAQTFILALDGDVDFQPEAVDYLFKGMEKNKSVGACCGRIHPIGSGPVIWYQIFEYAASHWLQKATEHVCGCVLCSPGCFTLLRGSAIVDVLAIYSKDPITSWQMIQFDQGEDRWLCTLLLKQGYRIEYCAAADAKTFAPEGFTEFFKQRRRWIPSTIANIIDILANSRYCAKKNNSISKLYLAYQAFLLCTAVITPASILLLMIGATVIAFDLAPWVAMILVILPTVVFTISIFAGTEKTQLLVASTMSGIYATIMVVVLIGIFKSGIEAGICSETTIFICFVGGIFVVAAILHPREWMCILPGLMYFFAVPSASVILMIYAIGNIHITSWGTREGIDDKKQTGKEVECSLGNICKCILFPDEASSSGSSPKFRTELRDCTLEEGKTLDLRADVTGYPKPKITWYLDNKKIHKANKIKITFNVSTARLKIKDINVNYSGKYCCVAENEKGKDRLQVQVRVLGKSTKPFGPKFNGDLISRTVQNGYLILETDVTGFPTPKITWDKDGVEIQRDKYFKPRQCGSNVLLKIINAGELRGKITCFAKNELAAGKRVYNLGDPFTGSDKKRRAPTILTSPNERKYWENQKNLCLDSKKQKLGVKEQEDISTGLKDLRNKVFFGFFLVNIVYFTFVVSLTQTDSTLNQIAFEFPCLYADSVLRFNPIIIAFIGTFGVVLLIQFWGMIYHRMSTFVQIITSIQKETNVVKPENKSQIQSQSSSQQTSRPSSAAKKNGEQ